MSGRRLWWKPRRPSRTAVVLTLLAVVIFSGLTVWQLVHYSARPVAIGSPGNVLLLVDRVAGTHEQLGPCGGQPFLGPGVPLPRLSGPDDGETWS